MSKKALVLFVSLCVIWGIPYMFTRIALREVSPTALIFMRTALSTLVLLPFALHQGRFRMVLARWRWVAVFGICQTTAPWLLIAHAQQRITSSLAGLLVATVPLLTAVLYRFVNTHERLDGRRLLGLFIGFGGVAALVGIDIGHIDGLALAEMLLAACSFTIAPLVILTKLSDLPGLGVATLSLTTTAILCAPFGLAHLPSTLSGDATVAFLGLALICTTLPLPLLFALVKDAGPERASIVTYINPAVAILAGVIILGEPMTVGMAVGFPLVLLGSVLGTARPRQAAAARTHAGSVSVEVDG